jgi:hypothetical protein
MTLRLARAKHPMHAAFIAVTETMRAVCRSLMTAASNPNTVGQIAAVYEVDGVKKKL